MILLIDATHFVSANRVGAMTFEDVKVIPGLDNLVLFGNEPAVVTDTTNCNSSVNGVWVADSNLI